MKTQSYGEVASFLPLVAILSHHPPSSVLVAAAAVQCNETTDALLRVSYSADIAMNTEPGAGGNDVKKYKRLEVRPSGNIGNSSYTEVVDYALEDLVDYEMCVPKAGACLEVALHNIQSDDYEITWDGRAAGDAVEFQGINPWTGDGDILRSTEVGDYCSPICDRGEGLFEYRYSASVGFEDYRVEDNADGGNVVLRCDSWEDTCQEDNTYGSLHTARACLKRDACYTFLVGDNFQRIPGESYHSLRWDGGDVGRSSANKLFESIEFGDACGIAPSCDPEEESRVELFVHRVTSGYRCDEDDDPEPDFTWQLKAMTEGGSDVRADVSTGSIPGCSNSSLYHEVICIPKDRCASFSITSSEAHAIAKATYTLSMDDVIYNRKDLYIDDASSDFDGLEHSTIMGTCAAEAICDESSNQALLEVDVVSPADFVSKNDNSLAAIPGSFVWNYHESRYSSSSWFNHPGIDLDSVYRTVVCVPDDECKYRFVFDSDFPAAEYSLRRNGIEVATYGGIKGEDPLFGEGCDDDLESSREGEQLGTGESDGAGIGGTKSDVTGSGGGKSNAENAGSVISRFPAIGRMLLTVMGGYCCVF